MTRKKGQTTELIKGKLDELVGRDIYMEVCRGRKQIKRYNGVIEDALTHVFVVRVTDANPIAKFLSYSYSDILCGEVTVEAK